MKLAALLSCAVLAATVAFAGPAPRTLAVTNCTVDATIDGEEYQFLLLINSHRQANGLGPLHLSDRLNRASAWKSQHMASDDYFAHDDTPIGRTWVQRFRDCGYTYNTYLGENIAAGNATASATFQQWRKSPGHNNNMLDPNFTAVGIGRAYGSGSQYGWYWTTDFGGYRDGFTPPATPTPTPFSPTATPTSTPTPTETAMPAPSPTPLPPTPTPTPLPPLPPASGIDSDGDGCDDAHELSLRPERGGLRDPNNPWDFFDTPDANNVRDGTITIGDIFRFVPRFGATGDPSIDLLSAPPPSPAYHTAFDRSPPSDGGTLAIGPADGSITASDILAEVAQFGHTCVLAP